MMEWLETIDQTIVLSINSLHTPWLDEIMWLISGKLTWIPLYIALLYYAYKKLGPLYCLYFILILIASIVLSDLIASKVIKEIVGRYRPSHHLILEKKLHFYQISPGNLYQGGQYGFVSSHAANFFAMATFYGLVFSKIYPKALLYLFLIAFLVSFSRIYLGVHYLTDIIGGAIVGSSVALLLWKTIWSKRIQPFV